MTEYGLFDDEGLIEGQFCSREAAHAAIADRYPYSYEEELIVAEVCPEGQRADTCEECNVEAGVPPPRSDTGGVRPAARPARV